jgi:hypothetical protein
MKWIHGDPDATPGDVNCEPLREQLESLRGTQLPLVFYNNNDIRAASKLTKVTREDYGRIEGAVSLLNVTCKVLKMAAPLIDMLNKKKKDGLLEYFNATVDTWPKRKLAQVCEVFEALQRVCKRRNGDLLGQMDILLLGYLCEETKKDMKWIAKSGLALLNAYQADRNVESDSSEDNTQ